MQHALAQQVELSASVHAALDCGVAWGHNAERRRKRLHALGSTALHAGADLKHMETRAGRRQFTYSKVMAWAALDCDTKDAERFEFEAPL